MKYLWRDGEWIEAHRAAPLNPPHARGPMIIRDQMDPIACTLDGRMFDSKSVYQRHVKEAGCEIVGNDRAWIDQQPRYEPQHVGQDVKRAIQELESR